MIFLEVLGAMDEPLVSCIVFQIHYYRIQRQFFRKLGATENIFPSIFLFQYIITYVVTQVSALTILLSNRPVYSKDFILLDYILIVLLYRHKIVVKILVFAPCNVVQCCYHLVTSWILTTAIPQVGNVYELIVTTCLVCYIANSF